MAQRALPRSALGKVIAYTGGLWTGLVQFLENPKIPLGTNGVGRALRGVAVGRKNHYGSRSERGTRVVALFYSLIESAKLCGVEPRGYLREATLRAIRYQGTVTLAPDLRSPESWERNRRLTAYSRTHETGRGLTVCGPPENCVTMIRLTRPGSVFSNGDAVISRSDHRVLRRVLCHTVAAGALLALSGCLPGLEMDLSPERWEIPGEGPEVSITSVVDERQFTATRSTRALPSLDPERSSEMDYRARAIGRHNNGSEVLLPVGRSVEDVARETVIAALSREGFRVVPLRDGSLPIDVVIERFWGWTSGNWVIFYHFDAALRLEVHAPNGVRQVRGNTDLRLGSMGSNVNMRWKSTMARGLSQLVEEMRSSIRNRLGDVMPDAGWTHPAQTRIP